MAALTDFREIDSGDDQNDVKLALLKMMKVTCNSMEYSISSRL